MIQPHGGTLINKLLPEIERQKILEEIEDFEKINVDSETCSIIKSISHGVFSPLEGFMTQNDTLHVLDEMYLESNIPWPFPIVLDVSEESAKKFSPDDQIIISAENDTPIALLKVKDIYAYDKKGFAEKVYGTLDPNHPGVKKTLSQKDFLIGGEIFLINELLAPFPELDLKPLETRV
ncbi:MAG: sulfate adenylyltransferase, partial [Candidatus Lokiarchaeota archaeon]